MMQYVTPDREPASRSHSDPGGCLLTRPSSTSIEMAPDSDTDADDDAERVHQLRTVMSPRWVSRPGLDCCASARATAGDPVVSIADCRDDTMTSQNRY